MRVHQAISLTPGQMKYRDISCLCKREECVFDYSFIKLMEVTLTDVSLSPDKSPASGKIQDIQMRPEVIESKHIGEWCIVSYDSEGYPGVIMDV